MRCNICGQEFGTLHDCPGQGAAAQAVAQEEIPSLRFAPGYYLGQAVAIARFNDRAILRASRDNNVLLYGTIFWFLATLPVLITAVVGQGITSAEVGATIVLALPIALVMQVALWGLCHLVARVVLKGRGRLGEVVRPMLLGSVVGVIAVIPVLGVLIAAVWSLAIMMFVFEEIHGIRRIQAFGISFGVGLLVRAIGLM